MSIVALGSFNPAIFHPVWFQRQELIPDAEAKASDVKVISPQVAVVQTDWFTLQVTEERFAVETVDPRKFLPLRDLVSATFAILEHTPITAFGLNSHQSFQLDSTEAWHQFGHHFAPKESWRGILDQPGLTNLAISGKRPESLADRIQISIQPAVGNGVVISVNEHYQVKEPMDGESASANVLVDTLDQAWTDFQEYSRRVGEHLLLEGKLEDDWGSAEPASFKDSGSPASRTTSEVAGGIVRMPELLIEIRDETRWPERDDVETSAPRRPQFAPPLIRLPPGTLPKERLRVLQQWEGVVTDVTKDSFFAEIQDLSDSSMPLELVEIPIAEISEDDRSLLGEGAVFYWCIGYETSQGGQLRRMSEIRMRRRPRWTRRTLQQASRRAEELFELHTEQ